MMRVKRILYTSILIISLCTASAFISNPVVKVEMANATDTLVLNSLNHLAPHPYLFADKIKLDAVKSHDDAVTRKLKEMLFVTANRYLTESNIIYPFKEFKTEAMRSVQGRILYLGLAYRLSGDKHYFIKARQELLGLCSLSDWGTNHFLDVGEASFAAAIGLDWFYENLTPEDREQISNAIINNALLPSLKVKEGKGSWVTGDFNWAQVCHAGLVTGALAIAKKDPLLACEIINRGISGLQNVGASYYPDGAYAEGPSYWSYGTTFHVIMIEALRSALGSDFDLQKFPGFLKTGDYNIQMVAPSGLDFNYSDYHMDKHNEPVMLWFARELKRGDLETAELEKISEGYLAITMTASEHNEASFSRHLPLELLWWDRSIPSNNTTPLLHWTSTGILPIAVIRSSWTNPKAIFVAMKGGTPEHSHAHMDIGSFIIEANGVRWALDLGTESYDKMRNSKIDLWNYNQNSTRWSTFRVGPDGHNILRFNNANQLTNGKGQLVESANVKNTISDEFDLTSVYADQAGE